MSGHPEQFWSGLPEGLPDWRAGRNNFSYLKYQALGGCLEEDFFSLSLEFLGNGQVIEKGGESYCFVCRHYAKLVGFSPGLSQERLYAYLRAMVPSARRGEFARQKENGENSYPWQMSDQALLAEVFLLTGDTTSYRQFTAFFPNIFGKKDEEETA